MIPEEYRITIDQVIKTCKLDMKSFREEVNFTNEKRWALEHEYKEQQRRLNDPVIAIVEQKQQFIDEEEAKLIQKMKK